MRSQTIAKSYKTGHALNLAQNGLDYLFVRSLDFTTGWPVIGNTSITTPYPAPALKTQH